MAKATRIGSGPLPGNFWGFSPQQRARIEAAYGRRISSDVWERIEAVTNMLAVSTPVTKEAAKLPVILQKTKRLTNVARSLRRDLLAGAPSTFPACARSLSDVYQNHFRHDPNKLSLADTYPFLLKVLEGVISLGDFIEREQPADLPAGEFWGLWIIMVANSLKAAGLPVSARKDSSKAKKDASPFILMICALQNELPKESRPQYLTPDAVSQAYHRARTRRG